MLDTANPANRAADTGDPAIKQIVASLVAILLKLPPSDRERVLRQLNSALNPIPTPRAGEVLSILARVLPKREKWTIEDIRQSVEAEGVRATPKEVANQVGYLARRGHLKRVGYGRYLMPSGGLLVTSDELGGEPARNEDD